MTHPRERGRTASAAIALALASLIVAGCATTTTPQARPTTAGLPKKGAPPLPGVGDPPIYWATIRTTIAHAFHRTPRQLAPLWGGGSGGTTGSKSNTAPTGQPINVYAAQHGWTVTRLRTLELHAVQLANSALIHRHRLTATAASRRLHTIRSWSQSNLDGYTMFAFQPPQYQ